MGQISIRIANRTYRLSCGDGDEARLLELAEHVRLKAEQLQAEHGRIADDHLMLMSAILIADELWDERAAGAAAGRNPKSRPQANMAGESPSGATASTASGAAGDRKRPDGVRGERKGLDQSATERTVDPFVRQPGHRARPEGGGGGGAAA